MVSDFIDEYNGCLRLSDEEHALAKVTPCWASILDRQQTRSVRHCDVQGRHSDVTISKGCSTQGRPFCCKRSKRSTVGALQCFVRAKTRDLICW